MWLLITICTLSVLLWIGKGDFYTKGEPREASVAVSMIEKNQWILPEAYADEIAYKPPLVHWAIALFSLPKGEITPLSARLPSAISFICLICFTFVFFGKNLRMQDAFLSALILITCFELHRAAMTSRVDMTLTFFIVLGLQRLFRWEERKKLKGFPLVVPIVLGLATLTKGPVGIALPLLVFGIYLLVLKYNFWKIVVKLLPVALAAFVLPLVWYVLAYLQGGKAFLDVVWAENFGRFLGSDNLNIQYYLGHEVPFWHNFITLLSGFLPWTLLLVISLFGLNYHFKKSSGKNLWQRMAGMEKIKLFSLISAVVIILFYCIPASKRSVYLMPAYPFIAIFIAEYILYLTEYKAKITRIFSWIIGIFGVLIFLIWTFAVVFPIIDLSNISLEASGVVQQLTPQPFYAYILIVVLLYALFVLGKHLWKKNHLKVLYATIGVYLAIFMVMDGIFFPAYKDSISIKPFAQRIARQYPLRSDNVFVMNNLLEYSNMYGLNFYLHNAFHNFETEKPSKGFFLTSESSFEKVLQKYGQNYSFQLLEEVQNKNRDGGKVIQLYSFKTENK